MRRLLVLVSVLLLAFVTVMPVMSQQGGIAAQQQLTHVVQPGENLFRIALRYRSTINAIAAANGISNVNLIYVGQSLVIPGTSGGVTVTPPPVTTVAPGGSYVVQPGDTLGRIARRFNTTIRAIANANNILNINLIFVGQRLNIPGATGGVTVTPVVTVPGITPIPSGSFELGGQVFAFSFPNEMRSAGMTWVKSQVRWNQGDPASIAQGAIDAARRNNFKVLLSIVGDPAQLGANPTQYIQNYATFVGQVAALRPDAIEVWNEQNIDREWPRGQISPATYTSMLAAAYQSIKRANPNTLVISGGPAPTGFFGGRCTGDGCDDDAYIRGMAAAGAALVADCIGIHYNEGVLPPDATRGDPRGNPNHYTRYYPSMVNLYASVFPNKPLCFTELGYLTPQGLGPLPAAFAWAQNTTIQQQAEWLARAATLARQSGRIRMMIVFNIDATTYGADPQQGYAIVRNGQCVACTALGAVMGVR